MTLDDPRFWVLAAVVVAAFGVEAAAGFGATVIAVSLAVHLFPLDALLPVIVPLGLVLSATIAWRERAHTDRRLLVRRILPVMGLGLVAGIVIFERASNDVLQRAFGTFVVAVAALELWRSRAAGGAPAPLPPLASGAALLGAGVIHGMFSTGGPLLVWALGRAPLAKRAFRATLSTVWLLMGGALSGAYALRGHLDAGTLAATAALLPALGAALALGEWLHHRLDEARFRRVVYALLLVTGLTNLV
ncbi:MAG TPA: sulfite exporter TauE/SafE family protein [Myxococcota bacterium]